MSLKNAEATELQLAYGDNRWCQLCYAAEQPAYCRRWRQTHVNRGVENLCSGRSCQRQLCSRHSMPQRDVAHVRNSFFTYCPTCYKNRTHCTTCGVLGRGGLSLQYGEPMRWEKNTRQNLWQCGIGGCARLLCPACGANFDGCLEHSRYDNCMQWNPA